MINFAVIDAKTIVDSLTTKNAWKSSEGLTLTEEEKQYIGGEYIGYIATKEKIKVFCKNGNVLFSSCICPQFSKQEVLDMVPVIPQDLDMFDPNQTEEEKKEKQELIQKELNRIEQVTIEILSKKVESRLVDLFGENSFILTGKGVPVVEHA